jgi:hypothetical protein
VSNGHPPWAAYRALMACRLIGLDKCPGVRPVGIGEIWRRLIAKCIIEVCGHKATQAAGNLNLCAGLPGGIEGAIHAVRESWDSAPVNQNEPLDDEGAADEGVAGTHPVTTVAPATPGETEEMDLNLLTQPPEPPEPHASSFYDASNGFNELGRKSMLNTVRHRWASGARFAFNCYRHSAQLVCRRRGDTGEILLSMEGVTQGDPLAMILYGIALTPLAEGLRRDVPGCLQPWYADDAAASGKVSDVARVMELLMERGPHRGYFLEVSKSIVVCQATEREAVEEALSAFQFDYRDGTRYVGGFVGSDEARQAWLMPQIQRWVRGVTKLATIAKRYPQSAYAGLTKSLQSEWMYLQRVVPDTAEAFEEVEKALAEVFLPALLGQPDCTELRGLFALPVKQAGLGLPDPVKTAPLSFAQSVWSSGDLVKSLRDGSALDVNGFRAGASKKRRAQRKEKTEDAVKAFTALTARLPKAETRKLKRAKETGAWLTATPDRLNGTELAGDEFRDGLCLRYNFLPKSLPPMCDGCGQKFSVSHAMSCKKGGLVLIRHNDVKDEWNHLCSQAFTPSNVSDEPFILSGPDREGVETPATAETPPELRGDVAVHGFWKRGMTGVFDVRITDTDAPSNRGLDPIKILARHEKEKKAKYGQLCHERRRHFTPLVFSVDGLQGKEATAAMRRLSAKLATKWGRTYSEVCGFVRSRLSIAIVRSAHTCLRGTREPNIRTPKAIWECGSGLSCYR